MLYREKRNRARIKRAISGKKETTEYALFVRTVGKTIRKWDRKRISRALVREAELSPDIADKIASEVEDVIVNSRIKHITTDLIREVVNTKLIEHGLEEQRKRHARLGVPLYDVERILLFKNKENANIPHNPEATNMTLAEWINKQFALSSVFDPDIADAHTRGDIHLHDLGFINRPYCSGQSLEYVKKFGLKLPNALSNAKPARHPEILLAHMVKFSAALQGHFAGAIGWDAVNLFLAPFLKGMSDKEIHQLAQMLIFEYSQQNVARGGQAIFSDINLYWEIPKHFQDVDAIGPGGEYTGKKYKDYLQDAQRFVWAMFDIYKQGDASGSPFFFPKPLVHMTDRFFQTPGWQDFLYHISDVAADKGNTYFVFDRGETAKISECCRLSFKLEQSDIDDAATPWKMRYSAIQNVTINLPRIAYRANHNDAALFELLKTQLELVAKAHIQKKAFLEKLLALKSEGPLALLTMHHDGESYLRMHRATFLVGILGLNEMVQYHLGKELHDSDEVLRFGLKVNAEMYQACHRLSEKYGIRFVLEQTPAESTAYRLAKLDLHYFSDQAQQVVKGNLDDESVYYTNSTYFNVGEPIDPIDRVYREGKFHDMIEAGALTHVWLADARPPKESVANFVIKTYRNTRNAQIAFSPEFTTCKNCMKTSRGLVEICPYCGSSDVDFITRVTGFFSKVSGWNAGKRAELLDRHKDGLKNAG
ncbi:anaerobic ribonucleoside-triphosphate reductase [candidate division WOR-3 bacterium JGI_Cruoil_03_51_56]|uniref:Anaerobic ribonucleoside-triphosphate reductase n=1 Tax=candidate division WOR-3 bacterium JGI_Cruoil_03_51_56 TaxID=1973747 RepID=A0A235BWR8_UNCW3|nr:MAG: anaerobic ribonucleoside-triphosphate reductase [candidate division WOR-3 bacterium JGI_Cruoil_03_51_56]